MMYFDTLMRGADARIIHLTNMFQYHTLASGKARLGDRRRLSIKNYR